MTVAERIKLLAEKYGGVEKFSQKCEIKAGSLRSTIHRDGELKSDVIGKITLSIPNLNLRWLLLGEGEMFVNEDQREDGDLSGQEMNDDNVPYIKRLNDLLEKRVNELERELKDSDPDKARELGIE